MAPCTFKIIKKIDSETCGNKNTVARQVQSSAFSSQVNTNILKMKFHQCKKQSSHQALISFSRFWKFSSFLSPLTFCSRRFFSFSQVLWMCDQLFHFIRYWVSEPSRDESNDELGSPWSMTLYTVVTLPVARWRRQQDDKMKYLYNNYTWLECWEPTHKRNASHKKEHLNYCQIHLTAAPTDQSIQKRQTSLLASMYQL